MGGAASVAIKDAVVTEATRPDDASDVMSTQVENPVNSAMVNEVVRLRQLIKAGNTAYLAFEEEQRELNRRQPTGRVKIIYEQYDDQFDVKDGMINVNTIDEEYCLSDVMPGCTLELLDVPPQDKIKKEIKGVEVPFVKKDGSGEKFVELFTYTDGMTDVKSYWVVAFQDEKQREADMAKTKERLQRDKDTSISENRTEGCSCLEGNPCTEANKYNCKNWAGRFVVAAANGWKGF